MNDMIDDHDRWVERQFRTAIAQYSEMDSRIKSLTGRSDLTDDYGIEAVVGSLGSADPTARVKEINLTTKALGLPPERLAGFILRSIREAEADYAKGVESIFRESWGDESAANEAGAEMRKLYPSPEPEDSPQNSWDTGSSHTADDDDDGWNQPILRS